MIMYLQKVTEIFWFEGWFNYYGKTYILYNYAIFLKTLELEKLKREWMEEMKANMAGNNKDLDDMKLSYE